jgi:DNA modification methylase
MASRSKKPAPPDPPGISIRYAEASSLRPYEHNARTHSTEQIAQIAASIEQFGFTNPILLDKTGTIIAGHGRLMAAQSIGRRLVPVIDLVDLSPEQARALVIADNKLALNAGWDEGTLASELAALGDLAAFTGFSAAELDAYLNPPQAGLTDPDDVPEMPVEPVSVLGDHWLLGRHHLVCGDCTNADDVADALAGAVPHLMVTDPPYGVEYEATWRGKAGHATLGKNRTGIVEHDDRADWREAWSLFPGSIAYVWHGGLMAGVVAESLNSCDFTLRSQIIWNKTVMAMGRGDYHWKHEPCWYAVRGTGAWAGDRKQTTVWDFPSPLHIMSGSTEVKTPHPTQKPVECMKRPIENNSQSGDAVYEPFLGSGTTLIAAEMTGRICHALEIAPAYVDVAVERWQAFTGKDATCARTGQTFNALKAERLAKAA